MFTLGKKFKGNPRSITLLQRLNSIEEGNTWRAYYSEIGYRAKKLNVSWEDAAKVTMMIKNQTNQTNQNIK